MRTGKLTLALGLFVAVALRAEDFWEKKKFTEWTEKEVNRILRSSPWAASVDVRIGMPMGPMGGRSGRGGGMSGPPGGGFGGEEGPETGGGGGRPGGFQGPDVPPSVPVIVRWQTALPVRQALARARFGAETATSPEAAQMLSAEPRTYVIGVAGVPPLFLRGAELEKLKAAAVLKIKGREPLHAADVRFSRQDNHITLFLVFPRTEPGGYVIRLEDKEVEFGLRLAGGEIRRKFKLKDMVYEGKLEL